MPSLLKYLEEINMDIIELYSASLKCFNRAIQNKKKVLKMLEIKYEYQDSEEVQELQREIANLEDAQRAFAGNSIQE
jgi:hypothetical protein